MREVAFTSKTLIQKLKVASGDLVLDDVLLAACGKFSNSKDVDSEIHVLVGLEMADRRASAQERRDCKNGRKYTAVIGGSQFGLKAVRLGRPNRKSILMLMLESP